MNDTTLIQEVPVTRNAIGMFTHPGLPQFDAGNSAPFRQWLAAQDLQLAMVSIESAPAEIFDRYFQSNEPDCSYWDPDSPAGDGWFCLAIQESGDGVLCSWVRRQGDL
ncbi:hypothetical protein C4K03_1260 [Pseudomonas synxantha]|uniref:Uncharacterized protein n=1 Tax=Pseudomonas synxantha TaxID=47883 RepID=A0A3G7U2Q0_9PSED|nr:hypothetical protein [Pseudomonas synxantha]AZE53431.1 hypothetical protein C4K03_1260 [Pseudomonas synxantha]